MAMETVGDLFRGLVRRDNALDKVEEEKQELLRRQKKTWERVFEAGGGVGGATVSGFVRGMGFSNLPTTQIPTDAVFGALPLLLGIAGVGGDGISDVMVGFGTGMTAPFVSRFVEGVTFNARAKK